MIKQKIIPYVLIMMLMIMCTMHNAIDFSIASGIQQDTGRLVYNIIVSALFGLMLDVSLFFLSKVKIGGDKAKILYQLISYFLISVWFIVWTLHMNMSMMIIYNAEPTHEFVVLLYKHILLSQFYAVIAAVFLKSISIPIHLKDFKNEV